MIKSTFFILLTSLCLTGYAQQIDADHDHEGHAHGGPPPKAFTLVSIGLTAGGAVMVTLTLLAIFWKTIDGAFHRSRYRERWQQRGTRIGFALGAMFLAAGIVGGGTYWNLVREEHRHQEDAVHHPEPAYGGVVKTVDRFIVEMVARRTGEIRTYVGAMDGPTPQAYELSGQVTISYPATGPGGETTTNQVLQFQRSRSFEGYLVVFAAPFKTREIAAHLSLQIVKEEYELDFDLPVQD